MKNYPHYIIGIFGASESGKSLISNLVEQKLRKFTPNVYQYALAKPLKDACLALHTTKGDLLFRRLVCGIGDMVKEIDVDFLWNIFDKELKSRYSRCIFILNDPRYQDQANHCDYTVKLYRSTSKSKMTTTEALHPTETDWLNIITDDTYINEKQSDPEVISDQIVNHAMPFCSEFVYGSEYMKELKIRKDKEANEASEHTII